MLRKIIFTLILISSAFSNQMPPALVETAKLHSSKIHPLSDFTGTVKFQNTSSVASQSSGAVKKIHFELGDKVKKGQILLTIDSELLDAQIQSVQASVSIVEHELSDAKKDLQRYKKLLQNDTISQKDYDTIKLKYDITEQKLHGSKAELQNLTIQKNKKTIKAPLGGTIVSKDINIGEWLSEGKSIASIVDTENIEILFNLPAEFITTLQKNSKYPVEILGHTLDASLYAVVPKGDTLTRTFPVRFKAHLKSLFVYDGAEAGIKLPKALKTKAYVIHRDALIQRFNQNVIFFINKQNQAMMLPVEIIGYEKEKVAIKAMGLAEGMDIVIKGNERVFPNQNVKVLKQGK